jgi:hypothetical protein
MLLLGMSALACGVDDRKLQLSAGTDGGTMGGGDGASSPHGAAAGAGSDTNAGGEAATPAILPPLVDGCADLDTDGVADCSVTLVKNATFQSDTGGWTSVAGSSLAWDARNAVGDDPSGCALLTAQGSTDSDGTTLFHALQCVPVTENQLVIAYANAWVEASAIDDPARAELQVSYFAAEDCSGTATGYFVTPPSAAQETWVTIQAGGVTGAGTQSVSVELVGLKPNRAQSLKACFDNVMVKAKPL